MDNITDNCNTIRNYIRINEPKIVDKETMIELVNKIKGPQSIRKFAEDIKVSPSAISRILSGKTTNLSDEMLAKLAAYANPDSGITLEKLLEAQGMVKRSSAKDVIKDFENECRRIFLDELFQNGFHVHSVKSKEDSLSPGPFDFEICTDALSGMLDRWLIKCVPTHRPLPLYSRRWFDSAAAFYYKGFEASRLSLMIDNENIYDQLTDKLSAITIPDEISIILVSVPQKRILKEYIVPLKDGRKPKMIF